MMKVLFIYDLDEGETGDSKSPLTLERAIVENSGFKKVEFHYLDYSKFFSRSKKRIGKTRLASALDSFITTWVSSKASHYPISKSLFDNVSWYTAMPALFITDSVLRNELQEYLKEAIESFQPDLIYAHSIGSLICYDYLRLQSEKGNTFNFILITSGSQLGHPSMRKQFGGKILALNTRLWLNLRNENDKIFASQSIKLENKNYLEIDTTFTDGNVNHNVIRYIEHSNTVLRCWPVIGKQSVKPLAGNLNAKSIVSIATIKKERKPNSRALLVGINNYPNPQNVLYGCVNDVFLVSETLQELGVQPEDIRVCLNERATANDIRERLDWLLNDTKDGDARFFFYSGHGTKIPSSHAAYEVDCKDESLVPYDFDWSPEHSFTDKEFLELYSHLPFGVDFISIFDCCNSGGMSRSGGAITRGISPPDDIRHREIKWDKNRRMWIPRSIALQKEKIFDSKTSSRTKKDFAGAEQETNRLGRAIPLWNGIEEYKKAQKDYGAQGPFIPVIIQACNENESAFEYRHGITSYGAFTYSFTTILREIIKEKKKISFSELVDRTTKQLDKLKYNQIPALFGPRIKTDGALPILLNGKILKSH